MDQYSVLAKYYDALMTDVDYEKWADFYCSFFGDDVKSICDMGCGTGSIATIMAKRGYAVTGVDMSPEMLCLAQKKADDAGVFVRFAEQDMSVLDIGSSVDGVICALDGVNYLKDTSHIRSCFDRVYNSLCDNGLFIFDINTPYKYKNILKDNAFIYELDDMFLSWQSFFNEKSGICDYILTFFAERGGVWHRYDEEQRQRSYAIRTIEKLILEAGFKIEGKYASVDRAELTDVSERAFFVCRKDSNEKI